MFVSFSQRWGIVRLMAVVAGHAAGVFGGRPPGESSWAWPRPVHGSGGTGWRRREFGNVRDGVVGVLRQRTVARFAGYVGVFAGGPGFGFLIVAQHAGILPGEGYGMLADQVERTGRGSGRIARKPWG